MKLVNSKKNKEKIILTKVEISVNAAIEYCEQSKRLGIPKPKIQGRCLIFAPPSPIKSVLFTKSELDLFLIKFRANKQLNVKYWNNEK